MTEYFHGGLPGLDEGDLLISHDHSGGWWRSSAVSDPSAVHITGRKDVALRYAASYKFVGPGGLYRVAPLGRQVRDASMTGRHSWKVERAEVVEVLKRNVVAADMGAIFASVATRHFLNAVLHPYTGRTDA